jgi:hypothetical protein
MKYELYRSDSDAADEHIFYFQNDTSLTILFYPLSLWTNTWKVGFFDCTCPIISFETPWVQFLADLRGQNTNVVRNTEI